MQIMRNDCRFHGLNTLILQVVPLANYYVLQGTIYQAPDLHHVLNSRLAGTLFHLQEALDKTLTMSR